MLSMEGLVSRWGRGAIGVEKASRGDEFGVRLPALKAACGR